MPRSHRAIRARNWGPIGRGPRGGWSRNRTASATRRARSLRACRASAREEAAAATMRPRRVLRQSCGATPEIRGCGGPRSRRPPKHPAPAADWGAPLRLPSRAPRRRARRALVRSGRARAPPPAPCGVGAARRCRAGCGARGPECSRPCRARGTRGARTPASLASPTGRRKRPPVPRETRGSRCGPRTSSASRCDGTRPQPDFPGARLWPRVRPRRSVRKTGSSDGGTNHG